MLVIFRAALSRPPIPFRRELNSKKIFSPQRTQRLRLVQSPLTIGLTAFLPVSRASVVKRVQAFLETV
jgi:hypothetical protein